MLPTKGPRITKSMVVHKRRQQDGIEQQGDLAGSHLLPTNGPGTAEERTLDRDLQREGDILRWRVLHYRHKFEHVANDSKLPMSVTGSVIAEANAEESRQSRCFLSWNDTITVHALRSDFWVKALGTVAEQ